LTWTITAGFVIFGLRIRILDPETTTLILKCSITSFLCNSNSIAQTQAVIVKRNIRENIVITTRTVSKKWLSFKILSFFAMLLLVNYEISFGQTKNNKLLSSLAKVTEDFTKEWFRGNLELAVDKYVSKIALEKPDLFPSTLQSEKGSQTRNSIARELKAIKSELWQENKVPEKILTNIPSETQIEINEVLNNETRPQALKEIPALAYQVRKFEDISWVGTAGPEHSKMFQLKEVSERPMYAVVVQIQSSDESASVPALMLWQLENNAIPVWKLITVLSILVQ